jgi:PAS domain S-box-containing protein
MQIQKSKNSLLTPAREGFFSIDTEGTIIEWNEGAETIFGYQARESIGKHISLIVCDTIVEKEIRDISRLKNDNSGEYEACCKNKNGKTIFVAFSASAVKDEKGNVASISQYLEDITEKRINEEKQSRLAAIVDSSDDAIISKTLDGIITSWNPSAAKMFGYSEKEAIGKHISIIIPKDRIDEESLIINNIRNGQKIDHFETIREAKDGTERQISLTVSPVKDSSGKIIGASKIARDISMRIEAEKQHELYIKRLQELNKYKDEFMVMASHELKTPLTVIQANLQLLEMGADPKMELLEKTVKHVKKLSALISNLLDVSKIQAGKLVLTQAIFDINHLIAETVVNLQQTTGTHHLIFNKNDQALITNGDADRIEQVLVNIIGNAIKYSTEPGDIIVNATKQDEEILVEVADKGIGIPEKDIQNIFLRYYRVGGIAASFSGSGVGLYISSEIIKSHGGRLWAESKAGEGSVFYFTLPAV